MSAENDTLSFKILNTMMSVKAGDDPEKVLRIASYVNQKLEELRSQSGSLTNPIQIALIGCLNFTEALLEAQKENSEIKRKLNETLKTNDFLSESLQEKKIEINQLQKEMAQFEIDKKVLFDTIVEKDEEIDELNLQIEQIKEEGDNSRRSILSLQNQLFEAQIELSKYQKA